MNNDKDPSDELKAFLLLYRDKAAVLQVPLSGHSKALCSSTVTGVQFD